MNAFHLYRDDVVTWSDQQVEALRELARRPELSNAIDWKNVIEEIETVGRSEWKGVESLFRNALAHLLKAASEPSSSSLDNWSAETDRFLIEARSDYRNSMRQLVDLDRAWRVAKQLAATDLKRYGISLPKELPDRCPFTLDELLDQGLTFEAALPNVMADTRLQGPGDQP